MELEVVEPDLQRHPIPGPGLSWLSNSASDMLFDAFFRGYEGLVSLKVYTYYCRIHLIMTLLLKRHR